jgi:pimeloyl-ACP methyl ester carboxylesterase
MLVVLVMVMGLVVFAAPVRTIRAQEATPAPRFTTTVEVDGRRIGLTCEGTGSPTVVLIGGMLSPADRVWPETVDALSPLTRVCVFDRAGQGASAPAPMVPQTVADIVADLGAALAAAGEAGPFVPVGFSLGGMVAQLFASTYPDQVAGLVLVEAAPGAWDIGDLTLSPLTEAEREGLRELASGREPANPSAPVETLISAAQVLAAPPPPPVPTVMIVAANTAFWLVPEDGEVTWSHLESVALYLHFQAGQARDLGARIVVAEESTHLVPFDQPEVMIAAIEDVVEAVRDPSSWATPAVGTPVP